MKVTDPVWYEALRGNPFRGPAVTSELASGVRNRIAQEPGGRGAKRPGPGWLRASLAIGAVCAVSVWALVALPVNEGPPPRGAGDDLANGREAAAGVESMQGQQETSSVVPPVMPGDRPALPVRMPSDSQWQELIERSYPEKQTLMLHKEAIREDVMLVFSRSFLVADGYRSASLVVDEFVWSRNGWKPQARVGYHPGDNLLESADQGLLTGWSGISLDPHDSGQFVTMFYGVVANPAITDIRVTDDEGRVHAAGMHDAGDGYAYWLAALPPGEKGGYTVQGRTADGRVLYDEYYYYR